MKKFDILRKFDDQLVCTAEQLSALVKAAGKGKEVALTVTRGGKEEVVKVLIDDRQVAVGVPAAVSVGVGGAEALPTALGVAPAVAVLGSVALAVRALLAVAEPVPLPCSTLLGVAPLFGEGVAAPSREGLGEAERSGPQSSVAVS